MHTVQQLSLLQGTPESLDKALELSEECGNRAPELRERVKKRVVNALVKQVSCSLVPWAHTQMSITVPYSVRRWVGAWLGGQSNVALKLKFTGACENNVVFLNSTV